jgi:8-oxo-dGTP diphosphatase
MKTDLVVAGYIFHNNKVLLIHHRKLNLWLPVGGHIEQDETPDQALKRETREEVNLDIEFLCNSTIRPSGNVKQTLALPFYLNVHSVGDHDHSCLYYVCTANNPDETKPNKELKNLEWFSKTQLTNPKISEDVRNQALKAFQIYEKSSHNE